MWRHPKLCLNPPPWLLGVYISPDVRLLYGSCTTRIYTPTYGLNTGLSWLWPFVLNLYPFAAKKPGVFSVAVVEMFASDHRKAWSCTEEHHENSLWSYVTMSLVIVLFLYNIILIENTSGLSSSRLSSGFVTQHYIFLLAWRAQAQLWRKLLSNHQPHKVHQTTNSWAIDPLNQIRLIWSFTASSLSHEVLFLGKLLFVHLTAIYEIKEYLMDWRS